MEKLAAFALMAFMLWRIWQMHRAGGIKALFEKSRNAEQHWGTFAIIMACVVLFVMLLIQL